jgi:hypothetical protein
MYRREDVPKYNFPPAQAQQQPTYSYDALMQELMKLRQENEQWRAWYAQNGGNDKEKGETKKKGKTTSQTKATSKEADEASKILAVIFITAIIMAFLYIVLSPKPMPERVEKTEKRR